MNFPIDVQMGCFINGVFIERLLKDQPLHLLRRFGIESNDAFLRIKNVAVGMYRESRNNANKHCVIVANDINFAWSGKHLTDLTERIITDLFQVSLDYKEVKLNRIPHSTQDIRELYNLATFRGEKSPFLFMYALSVLFNQEIVGELSMRFDDGFPVAVTFKVGRIVLDFDRLTDQWEFYQLAEANKRDIKVPLFSGKPTISFIKQLLTSSTARLSGYGLDYIPLHRHVNAADIYNRRTNDLGRLDVVENFTKDHLKRQYTLPLVGEGFLSLQCGNFSFIPSEGLFFIGDIGVKYDKNMKIAPFVFAMIESSIIRRKEMEDLTEAYRLKQPSGRKIETYDFIRNMVEIVFDFQGQYCYETSRWIFHFEKGEVSLYVDAYHGDDGIVIYKGDTQKGKASLKVYEDDPNSLWSLLLYIEMCFEDHSLEWIAQSLKETMRPSIPVSKPLNLP